MKKLTHTLLGAGLLCLAATHPVWAQGGPQASGSDNAARAGVGNQVTDPALGIPSGAPGDDASLSDNGSDAMRQAYKDYTDKKFPQAASELQAIVKKSPNTVEAHEMLADIYRRQNQIPQAIPELEAVVRLKPKDAGWRDTLGGAYLEGGDSDKAAAVFQTALIQNPKDYHSAFSYAYALEKGGKHAEAAAAFEKAAALDPKDSQALLYAGLLYHQAGSDAKAVPDLKTALALGTTDKFNAYTALAEAANTAKQTDAAIQDYTLAAQAKPDDFGTEANLGIMEQNAGRKTDAEAAYRQALTQKTDDPKSTANVQSNLAMLLTQDGKLDEAATLLTQATQSDPTDAALQNNLGVVYEKQGKTAQALTAYQKALALKPASGIAKDGVARLGKP